MVPGPRARRGGSIVALLGIWLFWAAPACPADLDRLLTGDAVSKYTLDADADAAYIASGRAHRKTEQFGRFDEVDSSVSVLSTFQPSSNSLVGRLGLEWERYWFSANPNSTLPRALESLNLVLGADFQLGSAILARVEAMPGFYGDLHRFSSRQFNVPIECGASYVYSDKLFFIVGASINYERNWPVFPAAGLLWHINDKLTFNGILPKPGLQYQLSDTLTLQLSGGLVGNTYRVNTDFGRSRGIPKLDNALVEYEEVRIGGGLTWKIGKHLSVNVEAGAVPYRRFDYNRSDYKIISSNTAPYAELDLSTKF
ncbi:MAG TPA: DUF6268 family outer membrane beta-barrel protein [Chthoniobacterales bacterium]